MNENFAEVTIPVPWGRLAGRWYGDQKQRPLVAVHGWLDNCGTYARLAPLLMPYTSLLCIDLPGHGYSSQVPAGIFYDIMEFVRILLRLMKAYKWEKISLMGHSMGGNVTFLFASLYPDCVDMIINLDILRNIDGNPEARSIMLNYMMERFLVENERVVQRSEMNEPPSYTYDECEQLLYNGTERSVLIENCKYLLERNLTKSAKYPSKYYFSRDGRLKILQPHFADSQLSHTMTMRICKNKIPFLVIRGGASTNVISTSINKMVPVVKANNENFELKIVENGTHHLHLNNPKETAEFIIDFWKRTNWLNFKDKVTNHAQEGGNESEKSKL